MTEISGRLLVPITREECGKGLIKMFADDTVLFIRN